MRNAGTWYPRRWLGLAPALLAVFMDMVDNQIVTVALPSIRRELGVDGAALEWIASGYTLAFALTLITGGRLGDRYGHRLVFALGCAGFTVASLAAGLAGGAEVLVAARVAQGAFAGLMIPQVLAYVQTEFPPAERGKAFGLYGITFPLGGMAGPLLGGLLVQADLFGFGWRSIFLVNLPVGIAATIAAVALMPSRSGDPAARLDLLGLGLLTVPLLALLYPMTEGWAVGWPAWAVVSMLAAVPLLILFWFHQGRREAAGREPLVRRTLLRRRGVAAGLAVTMLFFAGMGGGVFFVLTLYLQAGLHHSPLRTGLTFLPVAVGIMAGNGAARALAARWGTRLVPAGIVAGLLGIGTLLATLLLTGSELRSWELAPGGLCFGIGLGVVTGTLVGAVLADVPPVEAGSASGVVSTILQLGTTAGIALVGSVYLSTTAAGATPLRATTVAMTTAGGLVVAALVATVLLPRTPAAPGGEPRTPVTAGDTDRL